MIERILTFHAEERQLLGSRRENIAIAIEVVVENSKPDTSAR